MSESDLRSLYEWIDSQVHNSGGTRSWVLGGVIGGGAIVFGGLIPILLAVFHTGPAIGVAMPILLWLITSLCALAWFFLARSPEEKALARATHDMERIWYRLLFARWGRKVTNLLGAESAKILDDGARELLRTRSALKSPAWNAVQDGSP